jgi:hypothetical protein
VIDERTWRIHLEGLEVALRNEEHARRLVIGEHVVGGEDRVARWLLEAAEDDLSKMSGRKEVDARSAYLSRVGIVVLVRKNDHNLPVRDAYNVIAPQGHQKARV